MARKPNKIPTVSGGLTKDVFAKFLTTITNTKQKVSDAQTAHASEFKRCDALQIHPEALKLIQKLDRMGDEKRGNLLQAFDRYRTWMDWDAQLDLLEEAAPDFMDNATASFDEDDDLGETGHSHENEEQERGPAELTFASEEREEGDAMLEETAQAWEGADETPVDEESLDQGGYTFAEGKAAGREGKSAGDNPHGSGNASSDIWERGRAAGAREVAAAGDAGKDGDSGSEVIEGESQFAEDDTNIVNLFGEADEDEADPVVIAAPTPPGADAGTVAAQ